MFDFQRAMSAAKHVFYGRVNRRRTPPPPPEPPVDAPIHYLLNDPFKPIHVERPFPTSIHPPIEVRGYRGGGFARDSAEGRAANCMVTVCDTVKFCNSLSEIPVPKWAGTKQLHVIPEAGKNLNAFYDRRSIQFFSANHPAFGRVHTCDSSEIVSHELGHAILDAFRPDTWSAALFEVASFHEAFADMIALLHFLSYDVAVEFVIQETGGDLSKTNAMSEVAEQLGQAVWLLTEDKSLRPAGTLRSALNDFRYVNPATLPEEAPYSQLAAECHSFGRVFAGALYDLLVVFYQDGVERGEAPVTALKVARDVLGRYLLKAIQNAPVNAAYYKSMATTLLWADATLSAYRYHDRMEQVFVERDILPPRLKMLSSPGPTTFVRSTRTVEFALSDLVLSAQSDVRLADVRLEIPQETGYVFDERNSLIECVEADAEETLEAAQFMANHLLLRDQIDSGDADFGVEQGRLVRRRIS